MQAGDLFLVEGPCCSCCFLYDDFFVAASISGTLERDDPLRDAPAAREDSMAVQIDMTLSSVSESKLSASIRRCASLSCKLQTTNESVSNSYFLKLVLNRKRDAGIVVRTSVVQGIQCSEVAIC